MTHLQKEALAHLRGLTVEEIAQVTRVAIKEGIKRLITKQGTQHEA